ncbi:MAG: flagellar hook-basal body complex protein, partial [Mariprofundaceae bacterium]|nr:flagellar hook-basal body complex protein [Mariprofundaceae bacterium]
MMRSLWTAATGMNAQTTNVDVISNNLANVNTTGFKRGRANFQDLMYQQVKAPGSSSSAAGNQLSSGIQIGLGVETSSVSHIFSTGSMKQTGNPMDLAIKGRGFFEVLMSNGELAYTRSGSFGVDSQGQMVSANGDILQPAIT